MWKVSVVVVLCGLILVRGAVAINLEAQAQSAERAGKLREALTNYAQALQQTAEGSAEEQPLLEKIVRLAQKVRPLPATPPEALKHEGRAEAAFKSATSVADYQEAASEYRKALRHAPWMASLYFNLALVLEKAENYRDAIRAFKLYLVAAPGAHDAADAQKRIAGLEYQLEKAEKQKAEEADRAARAKVEADSMAAANARLAQQLVGIWYPRPTMATAPDGRSVSFVQFCRMQVRVEGMTVYGACIGIPSSDYPLTRTWYSQPRSYASIPYIQGKLEGGRLVGTWNSISYSHRGENVHGSEPYDAEIVMSPDGRSFTERRRNGKETVWLKERGGGDLFRHLARIWIP